LASGSKLIGVCGLALGLGMAIAGGGSLTKLALGVLMALLALSVAPSVTRWRLPQSGFLAIEAPIVLLLVSTLVLRTRDAEALAQNPLDTAGLFRTACVGLAVLLGIAALLAVDTSSHLRPLTTKPFRLYWPYLLVVLLGALLSVNPGLTAYRGLELAAALIVLAGACNVGGLSAVTRIKALFYWFLVALLSMVWFWVIISPGTALERVAERSVIEAPLPVRVVGVFPVMSANFVGTLGVILLMWSLGRLLSLARGAEGPRPTVLWMLAGLGGLTVIAAQYRTGYVATVVGLAVLLVVRRKIGLAAAIAAVLVTAALVGFRPGSEVERFVLRGQPEQVAVSLSGRTFWWDQALPVWQSSPLVGKGLLTASRFEVLDVLGRTTTATIHGTWIETLVGTGLFGTALLLGSLLICWRRALIAGRASGDVVPALLLAVLTVRSLTANTIESFGLEALLFLVIALGLRDAPPPQELVPLVRRRSWSVNSPTKRGLFTR